MTDRILVQRLDTLKARLGAYRVQQMTWREIAAKFPGVPAGTLCAVSKGRVPRSRATLKALGLVGPEPWLAGAVKWLRAHEVRR